jgi:DNA polymerase III epsilon subunit-like protein
MALDHFCLWYENDIVVTDVETTGFGPTDAIVEIAVVRLSRMAIVDRWSSLINPRRFIPPDATAVHGISDDDVRLSPTFDDALDEYLRRCGSAAPAAYQESFDRRFIQREACLATVDSPVLDWSAWLDPLVWVRSIDRFAATDDRKQSNALSHVCARYGIELPTAHRALDDATATAKVLMCLYGDMPRCTISELIRRQPFLSDAYSSRWERRRK